MRAWILFGWFLSYSIGYATVVPTPESMVSRSDAVVCATVLRVEREPYDGPRESQSAPYEERVLVLKITKTLKGKTGESPLRVAYPLSPRAHSKDASYLLPDDKLLSLGEKKFYLGARKSGSAGSAGWALADMWFGIDSCQEKP